MADLVISVTFADTTGCCGATAYLTIPAPVGSPPYADLAAATAAIANQTSNCKGYSEKPASLYQAYTFSGIDGGSNLKLNGSATDSNSLAPASFNLFGGINCAASSTVTMAWSYTGSGGVGLEMIGTVAFTVYDSSGSVVDNQSTSLSSGATSASGSFTSISLPATGAYEVRCGCTPTFDVDPSNNSNYALNSTFTSSGSFSVNPIRAAYGAGPSYLICV